MATERDIREAIGELLDPLRRELRVAQEVVDRERRLQHDVAARLVAPVDAVFDLLEESARMLERQAETLEVAGAALVETAVLMQRQAEVFEQTVRGARQPVEAVKSVAGMRRGAGPADLDQPDA
jgi:glycerol kinase